MVSSPRPAWIIFLILFLFHRVARTFFQSVRIILWHRAVSTPFLAPNAHFLLDVKTPLPWFPVSASFTARRNNLVSSIVFNLIGGLLAATAGVPVCQPRLEWVHQSSPVDVIFNFDNPNQIFSPPRNLGKVYGRAGLTNRAGWITLTAACHVFCLKHPVAVQTKHIVIH